MVSGGKASGGAGGGSGAPGLGRSRAAVAVELGKGSAGSFIGGQGGGDGSGWRRRQRRRCRGVAGAVRAQGGGVRCEATRHHGRAATAAGGSVPRSTLLCSVKAGRPWRGRVLGSGRRVAWRGAFVRVCALGQVG